MKNPKFLNSKNLPKVRYGAAASQQKTVNPFELLELLWTGIIAPLLNNMIYLIILPTGTMGPL